jgi:hypothetical protein
VSYKDAPRDGTCHLCRHVCRGTPGWRDGWSDARQQSARPIAGVFFFAIFVFGTENRQHSWAVVGRFMELRNNRLKLLAESGSRFRSRILSYPIRREKGTGRGKPDRSHGSPPRKGRGKWGRSPSPATIDHRCYRHRSCCSRRNFHASAPGWR